MRSPSARGAECPIPASLARARRAITVWSEVRVLPGPPPVLSAIFFQRVSLGFATLDSRFATQMFSFWARYRLHCSSCKPLLISCPRIPRNFAEAGVAADRGNLLLGASGFGESCAARLAQSVGAKALRQSCFIAPIAEEIAEASWRERRAAASRQQREVIAWRGVQH